MSRPTAFDERDPIQRTGKLRVGLLVDGIDSNKYVYDLARWAAGQDDLDFSHLLIVRRPVQDFKQRLAGMLNKGMYRSLSEVLFKLLVKFEQILLKHTPLHRDHLARFRIDELVGKQLEITPLLSRSGFVYRVSSEDIEAVRNLHLDLLIRCGSGILFGE